MEKTDPHRVVGEALAQFIASLERAQNAKVDARGFMRLIGKVSGSLINVCMEFDETKRLIKLRTLLIETAYEVDQLDRERLHET